MTKLIKPISLSYYIIVSTGIHAIIFGILTLISPLQPTQRARIITVNIYTISPEPSSASPVKEMYPVVPPVEKTVKKIQQKHPLLQTSKIIDEQSTILPSPTEPTMEETKTPINPAAEIKSHNKESGTITENLDSILQKKEQSTVKKTEDFLANASWIGTPRKTIAFPNISARISEIQNTQGYGYSVTARITFTPQGWVSSVELIRASGNPRIDYIFRNELRKIRIEENKSGQVDTVIKTFNISVK